MTRWQVFMAISPEKLTGHSPWEFLCEVAGELSVGLKQGPENNKPLLDVELTMKGAAKSSGVRHVLAHTLILWSAVKRKTGRGRCWPAKATVFFAQRTAKKRCGFANKA